MLKQEIIDDKQGHILITSDVPCRIELIKHTHKGTKKNQRQEFDIMYDTER